MTFEAWFLTTDEGEDFSLHDIVWEDGPHKSRDVAKWLEIAYEAGYKACKGEHK